MLTQSWLPYVSVGEAGAVSWSDVHLPWRRLCRHPMEVESDSDLCFSFWKVKVELSAQLSSKVTLTRYWDTKWQQDHSYGQENVNDRLGFHHVIMSVGLWPILLSTASEVFQDSNDQWNQFFCRFGGVSLRWRGMLKIDCTRDSG